MQLPMMVALRPIRAFLPDRPILVLIGLAFSFLGFEDIMIIIPRLDNTTYHGISNLDVVFRCSSVASTLRARLNMRVQIGAAIQASETTSGAPLIIPHVSFPLSASPGPMGLFHGTWLLHIELCER